jgi:hypothetical protein
MVPLIPDVIETFPVSSEMRDTHLIPVPLPSDRNPFAVHLNNNNNSLAVEWIQPGSERALVWNFVLLKAASS